MRKIRKKMHSRTENSLDITLDITAKRMQDGVMERECISYAGTRHMVGDKYYLRYKESIGKGQKEVPSMIVVGENEIRIHRTGALKSDLIFSPEEDHECPYTTPMGIISLTTRTKSLDIFIDEKKLDIYLNYELFSNGSLISENEINIISNCINHAFS